MPDLQTTARRVAVPAPTAEQRAAYEEFRVSIGDIQTDVPTLPGRWFVGGPEGSGKTTWSTGAPKPIFLTGRGETGLQMLIQEGRVPRTPHFPEATSWAYVEACVRFLLREKHEYSTLVIDTINTVEMLLHEHVCETEFQGDWGKKGFLNFNGGYEVALEPLRGLLRQLDLLRTERKIAIIMLGHTKVKTFKNPEGADYDRYTVDVHEKTWSLIHRWLDFVGFINFETVVTDVKQSGPGKKGKGMGGNRRVMHTERTAAYDAKNRLGLPEHIDLGTDPADSWNCFAEAVRQARIATREAKTQKETQEEGVKA